jgi:hypothetical protein
MVKANRNLRPALRGNVPKPGPSRMQPPRMHPTISTLRAFLCTHLGMPWATVREEYEKKRAAARESKPAPTQKHGSPDVWGGLVAVHTSLKHGHVRVHLPRAGIVPLEAADCEFFVHPELGTLLRNEHYISPGQKEQERAARRMEELHARMREVSGRAQAHKIGEAWYLVELGHLLFGPHEHGGRAESAQTVFDAVLGRHVSAADRFDLEHIYGRRGVYGVRKRALSYPELRKLGLHSPSEVPPEGPRSSFR